MMLSNSDIWATRCFQASSLSRYNDGLIGILRDS